MSSAPFDCLIVGAGPAGMTAALYLKRFKRDVRVIDAGQSRALRIPRSWNLPGFPEGIGGEALLARIRQQLADLGLEVTQGKVNALSRRPDGLFDACTEGASWTCRTVILATGSEDLDIDLPGISQVKDSGLLRECPICDGHEFSDRRIGVIGSSAHSAREALFLRHYSASVQLLAPRASDTSGEDWRPSLDQGQVRWVPTGIRHIGLGDEGLAVTMEDGQQSTFDVLYSALGCHPGSELGRHLQAQCDEVGNLVVDAHCRTSVQGLYAAGDVTCGLDQLVVAMSQGATAATAIHNELRAVSCPATEAS